MLSNAAQKLLTWLGVYDFTPGSYYYHCIYHPKAERRGLFASAFDELLGIYGYQSEYPIEPLTLDYIINQSPNHGDFTLDITAVDASYKAKSLNSNATTEVKAGQIIVDENGEEISISANDASLNNLSVNNTIIDNVADAKENNQATNLGQVTAIVTEKTSTYVYNQLTPSTDWTINHNLNKFPTVTVVDSAGTEVWCEVYYIDSNTIKLQLSAPFSGTVYCN